MDGQYSVVSEVRQRKPIPRLTSKASSSCCPSFPRRFTCGQMTFAEAHRKTGRVFCVTLSSTTKKAPPVLLNYLTTPNVTVASAVIASAAVPGFVPPVRLQYSKLYSPRCRISCHSYPHLRLLVAPLQRTPTVSYDLNKARLTLMGPSSKIYR